jgi:hypothetical protein
MISSKSHVPFAGFVYGEPRFGGPFNLSEIRVEADFTMTTFFCAIALLLSTSFQPQEVETALSWEEGHYSPPALPLTSYSDWLSGRLAADGTLDTGLVRLRFTQGPDGVPLEVRDLSYGKGAQLWAEYRAQLGDIEFRAVCQGASQAVGDDKRLVVSSQVKLTNPTDVARKIVLAAELLPSHESPVLVSAPFDASSEWSQDGSLIVRDEMVALGWVGPEPDVEILETTDSPATPVASLVWRLEIPAGESKYVELKLAGPPVDASVERAAWRKRFRKLSYAVLEESLKWESRDRGSTGNFKSKSKMLKRVIVNGLHTIRLFGKSGMSSVKGFTDNPYGHPASDAAIEPEMVGCLVEYYMGDLARSFTEQLIADIPEKFADLGNDRKLAYLHGLARAVRLSPHYGGKRALAEAIVEFGDPDVAVEPWHDPEIVRQDLVNIVESEGLPTDGLMRRLRWADVEEGSAESHMQIARRALSNREGALAWEQLRELFKLADGLGMGSLTGGELDAQYSVAMLTLVRAMLVDDHGDGLNLFPGISQALVSSGNETDTSWFPTRFGDVKSRAYYVGSKSFGNWTVIRSASPTTEMTVTIPDGLHMRNVKGGSKGGVVRVVPGEERLVSISMESTLAQEVRFQVRVN